MILRIVNLVNNSVIYVLEWFKFAFWLSNVSWLQKGIGDFCYCLKSQI